MIMDDLFPDFKVRVYKVMSTFNDLHGMELRVTSGLRSFEEQSKLYAKGRKYPGRIVTNAEPGDSLHNYGLAVDFVFRGVDPYLEKQDKPDADSLWNELGKQVKNFGCVWGGDFKLVDRPHMEMSYGIPIDRLKELYNHGGLVTVWNYINVLITIK